MSIPRVSDAPILRPRVAAYVEDDEVVLLCRWEPLPLEVALADGQGSLLGHLPLLLG